MIFQTTRRVAQQFGCTSLKTRVTVLTLMLFIAAVWLLAFRAIQELRRDFQEEIITQQATIAHYISVTIEDEIASRIRSLITIATRIKPEWLRDQKAMSGFLEQRLIILGLFKLGIYTIAKDGRGVADYPVLEGRAGDNYDQLDYFKDVMATGLSVISKPYFFSSSKQPAVVIAVPIKDETSTVVGVLAGANGIIGNDIFRDIYKNTERFGMDIHVISLRDNLFVTSTDPSRVLQSMLPAGRNLQYDRYLHGYEGSGIAVNAQGLTVLSSSVAIHGTPWFVVAEISTEKAFSRIENTKQHLYWEAGGLSLLFAGLIWLFLHREMVPLSRHAAALRQMTAGEVPLQTVAVEGSAEIRQLMESFNQLYVQIRSQEAILQESETRFRHLADSVSVLIWLADTSKFYFYFNKVWMDFTGRTFAQEVGNGWTEAVHPDDLQPCIDTYVKCFDARQSFAMEYRLLRHDGEYRWIYDQGAPRYDANGIFIGYVGGCIDITDRKLAEERLVEARKAAEAASHAKSAFLAMMSHELRTPMTGVIGMADFLSGTPLNEDQRLYIDTMRSSARTLLTVLNDILDYSKIDAGRLLIDHVAFDAVTLAAEAVRLFWPKAEENADSLGLDTDGLTTLFVKGDPIRIKQVLGNLISNAIKFTKNGKVMVRLRYREADNYLHLLFEVEDTGIGISPSDLGCLFLPFSQANVGATRKFGGTGLGLAISKHLVELMGGEISVTSQPGWGSLFRFSCLVEHAGPEDFATDPQQVLDVRPMTILLAEDNPINRMIVKIGLEQRHHRVTMVENGAQAYEAAAKQQFDLILMDMQMPVMDGAEATRLIRTLPLPFSKVPIVALTADTLTEHRVAYMEAGLTDFVAKPIRHYRKPVFC
ncbi:two-component system, sensor histidine kinase [Gammaproteobacteria bacterium]